MADPEIQAILQTPEVRNALQELQTNPAAIQNVMKNPSLAAKIQKLIEAGVIGTGWFYVYHLSINLWGIKLCIDEESVCKLLN